MSHVCPLCGYRAFTGDALSFHHKNGTCKQRQKRRRNFPDDGKTQQATFNVRPVVR